MKNNNTTKGNAMNVIVRFIDTKEIVWTGAAIDFIREFNGGLDADNKKVFEIIVEK